MQSVVDRAVEVVPGCDWASVTLRRRRHRTETVASTSDVARQADQLQYDLDEGPCLEAVETGEPRLSNRVAESSDWPSWGPRAAQIGVHALLGIQLSTDDEVLGALNFYAGRPDAFGRDDIDIAEIYATHATNALTAARLSSGLRTALHSRHMIGVAQGILMQLYGLSMEQSFELLRRYSSHSNTKLSEIAEHVVEHRALPEPNTRTESRSSRSIRRRTRPAGPARSQVRRAREVLVARAGAQHGRRVHRRESPVGNVVPRRPGTHLKCLTTLVRKTTSGSTSASRSAWSRSLPAGPTNGSPALSSWSPGCSPTTISGASSGPLPATPWVASS